MSDCSVDKIVKDETAGFFSGVAPQFSSFLADPAGVAVLQSHLDNAERLHSASYFGTCWCDAMALYAAHTLAIAYPGLAASTGSGPAVTSKKAGDLAISYAAPATSSTGDILDSTPWGKQFKALRKSLRNTPMYFTGY